MTQSRSVHTPVDRLLLLGHSTDRCSTHLDSPAGHPRNNLLVDNDLGFHRSSH
jgi:hypothetical protein